MNSPKLQIVFHAVYQIQIQIPMPLLSLFTTKNGRDDEANLIMNIVPVLKIRATHHARDPWKLPWSFKQLHLVSESIRI